MSQPCSDMITVLLKVTNSSLDSPVRRIQFPIAWETHIHLKNKSHMACEKKPCPSDAQPEISEESLAKLIMSHLKGSMRIIKLLRRKSLCKGEVADEQDLTMGSCQD